MSQCLVSGQPYCIILMDNKSLDPLLQLLLVVQKEDSDIFLVGKSVQDSGEGFEEEFIFGHDIPAKQNLKVISFQVFAFLVLQKLESGVL